MFYDTGLGGGLRNAEDAGLGRGAPKTPEAAPGDALHTPPR